MSLRTFRASVALACLMTGLAYGQTEQLVIANRPVEMTVATAGEQSIRITMTPIGDAAAATQLRESPALDLKSEAKSVLKLKSLGKTKEITAGLYSVRLSSKPLRIQVLRRDGSIVQDLQIDEGDGSIQFPLGSGPVFGLGEGGPQFDRKGESYPMKSSQEAYNKPYFGGRMPVPWLLSDGWALFLHDPQGSIELDGSRGHFRPFSSDAATPVDIFVMGFKQPVEALTEYARLTGFPSMPPIWGLGYEQSHRTVASREAVFTIARNFREKKLPCDVLIYLGTGWAPSGWNKGHRSFEFNEKVFPHPADDMRELHDMHFKVILHEMGPPKGLLGNAGDHPKNDDLNEAANYWKLHAPLEKLGVNGWWPDEGENLSPESRLARIRMYWQGPQMERPDVRPYTLNRAGYAGMQRYGGWLWSGDLNSTWRTLTNQVPVGINTGLTGVPYWGTDIGGFFSTKELTGELFVRWFQFGAFCSIFRAHGRPSATRYPWSWNTGNMGEPELSPEADGSAPPDPQELHNPAIEPICKKYLELRYRLMPYIYSAAEETHETGLPMMRALWLYYSDDAQAARRGDEFLWGRDMLVAPVTEKGAVNRSLYIPRGTWYDFWTNEKVEGGKQMTRTVDLATTPLYIRAGAIVPMGPVKQYTTEKVDGPLTVTVYPGADGHFVLYDDDGVSFDYEKGQRNKVDLSWNDIERRLTVKPQNGAQMWNELTRKIEIRLSTGGEPKRLEFTGKSQNVQF